MDDYKKRIKCKRPRHAVWWEHLSKVKERLVKQAYESYDKIAGTPLLDDLPGIVVTTICNYYPLYQKLRYAHHRFERDQLLSEALKIVGDDWMNLNELFPHGAPCQHLRGWLEYRELDELIERCELAVEREYERMQKEA